MKKAERKLALQLVGRAFQCPDGLVRWITRLSSKDNFSLLWRVQNEGEWNHGGVVAAQKWEGGIEVEAPQVGDHCRLVDVRGRVHEMLVQETHYRVLLERSG